MSKAPAYQTHPMAKDDIENRFTYHPPIGTQLDRYLNLRNTGKELAHLITASTPPSREQSLAITNLEQAIMWANAAIARNEKADATGEAR